MNENYINFLNHGLLPFFGREDFINQIMEFWKSTPESYSLRAMLVTGEAGIGKSRLVEHIIQFIKKEGGIVVHLKLYPNSLNELSNLITNELISISSNFVKNRTLNDNSINGIINNLASLSHIRSLIIIVEDVHLFTKESLSDLKKLLIGLNDEMISVLFLGRPIESIFNSIIEPYLIKELDLKEHSILDISSLLNILLGFEIEEKFVLLIKEITKGNSLAIKSGIRGIIKAGLIDTNKKEIISSETNFKNILTKSIESLSEGMLSHLNDLEMMLCSQLSTLGEIFSREAAEILIGIENSSLLNNLIFKGVLIETFKETPLRLGKNYSEYPPLSFTHSLVHDSFLKKSKLKFEGLISIIHNNIPLFSLIPFLELNNYKKKNGATVLNLDKNIIEKSIENCIDITYNISNTNDWKFAPIIIDSIKAICEISNYEFDENELNGKELKAKLLFTNLMIFKRDISTDKFINIASELTKLCKNLESEILTEYFIWGYDALLYNKIISRVDVNLLKELEFVDNKINNNLNIQFSKPYLIFIRDIVRAHNNVKQEFWIINLIKEKFNYLLKNCENDEIRKKNLLIKVGTFLITIFNSNLEKAENYELLKKIEDCNLNVTEINLIDKIKAIFLYEDGKLDESKIVFEKNINLFLLLGNKFDYLLARSFIDCIKIDLGFSPGNIIVEFEKLTDLTSNSKIIYFNNLIDSLILTGQIEYVNEVISDKLKLIDEKYQTNLFVNLLSINKVEDLIKMDFTELYEIGLSGLNLIIDFLVNKNKNFDDDKISLINKELLLEVFKIGNFINAHLYIKYIIFLKYVNLKIYKKMEINVLIMISNHLDWCYSRGLWLYMKTIVSKSDLLLDEKFKSIWKKKIEVLRKKFNRIESIPTNSKLKLKIFGKIALIKPNCNPEYISGERLRTALGIAVANKLIDDKLSALEFCQLVTGENDPEKARNTMRVVRLRLRELVGEEEIKNSESDPIILNEELIEVDIFDFYKHLRLAIKGMKKKSFSLSVYNFKLALEIAIEGIPFGGLYDDFFESIREEIENSIRNTTITLIGLLMKEHDYENAEVISKIVLKILPNDEEITDLLEMCFEVQGKKTSINKLRLNLINSY